HHHQPDRVPTRLHASQCRKPPPGRPYLLKLSAELETCVSRVQLRQFSLATLPFLNGLSSLQLVTCCTVSGTPRAGLLIPALPSTGTPWHFLRGAVSVSPNFSALPGLYRAWNGVEGGITASSAPVRPRQLV